MQNVSIMLPHHIIFNSFEISHVSKNLPFKYIQFDCCFYYIHLKHFHYLPPKSHILYSHSLFPFPPAVIILMCFFSTFFSSIHFTFLWYVGYTFMYAIWYILSMYIHIICNIKYICIYIYNIKDHKHCVHTVVILPLHQRNK